jgi:prepilin-type N-terminal cleavage/methylation domain-containing protein
VLPGGFGFTLIELLVVITIIGIIAAMVVGLGALAARKRRDGVVTAMKTRIIFAIDAYHSKMGFYPPDNAANTNTANYEASTGQNSLYYELIGATNLAFNEFYPSDGSRPISGTTISNYCGRGGIANSVPDETRVFFNPPPSPKDYAINGLFMQFVVPVDLAGVPVGSNFWHYDCSNPNRHNTSGFDLWAEYSAGSDKSGNPIIVTNGNWNLP